MVLDFSATDKPRRIQENMIAYMRMFAGLPGVVSVDNGTFWMIYKKGAPGSIILKKHWSAGATADPIEAQIDAVYAEIGISSISSRSTGSCSPKTSPPILGGGSKRVGCPVVLLATGCG